MNEINIKAMAEKAVHPSDLHPTPEDVEALKDMYIKGATDAMNQAISKQDVMDVIKYMCGYEDFPERKEGQGLYYWRTILREKFEAIGISKEDLTLHCSPPVIKKGE